MMPPPRYHDPDFCRFASTAPLAWLPSILDHHHVWRRTASSLPHRHGTIATDLGARPRARAICLIIYTSSCHPESRSGESSASCTRWGSQPCQSTGRDNLPRHFANRRKVRPTRSTFQHWHSWQSHGQQLKVPTCMVVGLAPGQRPSPDGKGQQQCCKELKGDDERHLVNPAVVRDV